MLKQFIRKISLLKNRKGSTSVIVAMSLPLIIVIMGMAIDFGILFYYDEKLSTAAKFSAISATGMYDIEGDKISLLADEYQVRSILNENFSKAYLTSDGFEIKEKDNKITCTVKASVRIESYFIKFFDKRVNILTKSYTAKRKIDLKNDKS